jgi:peptidoglycan/LPS O-acetylase OafA/YrhL
VNKVIIANPSKMSYRTEIDGLRAIAVISVILYHAQMILFGRDRFEGGYIGVDIFFVISGYLITRIILNELYEKGAFSFLNFYERRARRILPMLFLVIFVIVPFAWQSILPTDFVDHAESILASVFFGSNFFFYFSTTEYGADSALLKPFLHTWSLGVDEQFYLVFPILAYVLFIFFRKHLLTILVALSLLSLLFAELMEVRNAELNFYLPFSRFWELAVGSLLAVRELNYKAKRGLGVWRKILPISGLYLVTYAILFFDDKTPHPSLHTIVPILGVALIIGFASKEELVGKILGSKPFVWMGLISDSAYMWHLLFWSNGTGHFNKR